MIGPEYLSIHAVDNRLHRHPQVIRRWCAELGIAIEHRPFRQGMAAYILASDFERLREYAATQPRRLPRNRPPRQIQSADPPDRPDWRLGARVQEIARRIAAASRFKQRTHGNAELQEHDIQTELAQ